MDKIKTMNFNGGYTDKKVLKALNLKLPLGKFSALIGPNGSGKSTFVKYLIKALTPDRASLFIEGKDINDIEQNENARLISTVNQTNILPRNFTVFEITQMGSYSNTKATDASVLKALELTDCLSLKDEMINNLSIGQQQMVLLARAICQNTETIVLDEPFNNLDINHIQLLINTLKNLVDNGKTILCIMHDLNLVINYFDYCFVLGKSGNLIYEGKPEETINEKSIKKVYGTEVNIIVNPINNKKFIIV